MSRWGRCQDADKSAYYEYICRRTGIQIAYCAGQFENDGSPVSTIVKGVTRAMAGEYSRELSAKVFAGQCRLIERASGKEVQRVMGCAGYWSMSTDSRRRHCAGATIKAGGFNRSMQRFCEIAQPVCRSSVFFGGVR